MDETNNIFFYMEEKTDSVTKDNSSEIELMMYELENIEEEEEKNVEMEVKQEPHVSLYFYKKNICDEKFGKNNEFFYQEYTVKELLRICNYYDIEKHVKSSKCKKQDIIASIVYFESLPEKVEIVNKRHMMWSYITELTNEPKMKKYVFW